MFNSTPIGEIALIKQGRYLAPADLNETKTEQSPIPVWGANGLLGYTANSTYESPQPLVTCRGNGCGLVQWTGGPANISNNSMAIVLQDAETYASRYLYYCLLSTDFSDVTTGSAQPQITVTNLKNKQIFWTDNPLDQKVIAHILGTLDNKIELNRKISETLEGIAKAFFKSWFLDFDPVRAKAEGRPTGLSKEISDLFPDSFEDSELGEMPRGWSSASIDEACEKIFSGGTPSTKVPEYWNGTHGWLSSGETRSSFIHNTEKLITDAGIENSSTKAALRFDTVIASAGQGKTRGQTSLLLIDTYVNQSIVTLRAKKDVGALLLFFNLARRYHEFRTYSDSSSSRGSLTSTLLKELPFVIPTYEITSLFNKLILPLVEKIEVNLNENKVLSNLKDTLLPKLISGELKISDAENLIDEAGI